MTARQTLALELAQDVLSTVARPRRIDRYIDYFGGAARRTEQPHGTTTALQAEAAGRQRARLRRHDAVA